MNDASLPYRRLFALNRRYAGRRLVAIVPDAQVATSVRQASHARGGAAVGLVPAPVIDVARQIGRIHPQAQGKTPLAPETVRDLIRTSLEAVDPSTRQAIQGSGGLGPVVRRVAEVVRLLRSNDVAPASLYALTAGSAVRPNRRAVVVGFEAVQRHLLAASDYDDADLLGWATAQVRSGRAPHVRSTVYAAFDGVDLSEREAAFLRALHDEAVGFYRLGSASTPLDPPPASVAARFPEADVFGVPDAVQGPGEDTGEAELSGGVHVLRVNGTADEQVAAAREYADRETLSHGDVEILAPSSICGRVMTPDGPLVLRQYARGGFEARRHLVALWPQPFSTPTSPPPLLTDGDRDTLAELTGAVLPRSADADRREAWHLTQALWRGAGAAGVEAAASARRDEATWPITQRFESKPDATTGPGPGSGVPAVARSAYETALGDLVATVARLHSVRDDQERVHTRAFVRSVLEHHGETPTDEVVEQLQRDLRAFTSGAPKAWIDAADRIATSMPLAWQEPEPGWTVVDLAVRAGGTWRLVMVRDDGADPSPDPATQPVAKAVARVWSRGTKEPVEAGYWRTGRAAWEADASADATASSATEPIT